MILYVNGDSHSEGHDAVVKGPNLEHSYGKLLADQLKYTFICDAVSGCSNDSIINRTLDFLNHNNTDFVIIGWSTWERETWYWDKKPYNFTSSGTDLVHPMLQDLYKEWVSQSVTEVNLRQKEKENHIKIYLFHKLLENKKIPHLFFNCYSHFFFNQKYNEPKYNWGKYRQNYLDPYNQNMTYYFWLQQQGFKPSNPKYFHYGADAHRAWAEFLLPKVHTVLTHNG